MVKIGDLLAQITGEPSPTTAAFPSLPKRKPNEDFRTTSDQTHRIHSPAANSSRPTVQSHKLAPGHSKNQALQSGRLSVAGSGSGSATFKNGQPTPPPTNDPHKTPKKGSFAEIMARGKAAQTILGPVGKIQHKKIERLPSRREREAMLARKGKTIQKGLAPNSKFRRIGQAAPGEGNNGARQLNGTVTKEPEKKIKKAALATTGYAGTARPKPGGQPGSKSGPARSSGIDRDRNRKDRPGSRYDKYLDTDEEEEDIEEDDEQDYASDVSSDMEAAVFEVDEEEELAAKIARREDAEALAEENRLKKEKEEKRRRLLALAKKAGPSRY